MGMVLDTNQGRALNQILEWLRRLDKAYFTLGGVAGSGKTSLIPFLFEGSKLTPDDVAFCAYTGKASLVMQRKGIPAITIHRLIYEPIETSSGKVKFRKRNRLPRGIKLIIVDEASMVSKVIKRDLESFGVPILFIGDHFQLPPISEDKGGLMRNPDFKLNEIHRQAAGNAIIGLSEMARLGKRISLGKYGQTAMHMMLSEAPESTIVAADQILCGRNTTRHGLNAYVRDCINLEGPVGINDKVICLRNDWQAGLVNGLIGKVTSELVTYDHAGGVVGRFDFTSEDGEEFPGVISDMASFNDTEQLKWEPGLQLFDMGYAITVHRAQGSQFNKVLLVKEDMGDDNYNRQWLYTGITRAAEKLIIAS